MNRLPVDNVRDTVLRSFQKANRVVVTAPTGTGKSTRLPQFLCDAPGLADNILVLQPRRIAARMLARRVARERGQEVGEEIGYQTRFDTCRAASTRVTYITEGILPRRFLSDPRLAGVDAVVFDEFHERALTTDTGLGLVKNLQENGRPDLKLVVMSATLEAAPLAAYLGGCPVVDVQHTAHSVDVRYQGGSKAIPIWDHATKALSELLKETDHGDILVFMPGAHEIRRTVARCKALVSGRHFEVLPLYGDLPPAQQDRVGRPGGQRRIIVATNIAETSLTIPGVRHVIDSGLVRMSRYNAARGIDTLLVEPVSRHSAEQRRGRAGREGPGICVRLWSRAEQARRPAATDPEVHRTDLGQAALQVRALGFPGLGTFPWIDPPAEEHVLAAETMLKELGAVDPSEKTLTETGRAMADFPAHPRLAKLMLEAVKRGCVREAAFLAAVLNERTVAAGGIKGFKKLAETFPNTLSNRNDNQEDPSPKSDLFVIMNAVGEARRVKFDLPTCRRLGIHADAARQVWRARTRFVEICRRLHKRTASAAGCPGDVLQCLLASFPDHLAHRRDRGTLTCDLAGARTGCLVRDSTLRDVQLFVAGDIRRVSRSKTQADTLLSMASEVRREWLEALFPDDWSLTETHAWNSARKEVECITEERCRSLVLDRTVSSDVDRDRAAEVLATEVATNRLPLKGWNRDVESWIRRVRWTAEQFPEQGLITYDETDRDLILMELCAGERRYAAVRNRDCLPYVKNALSWDDQRFVEKMAPARVTLSNGRRMRIRYRPGHPPKGRARIQELYDLEVSPAVAGGRCPVLLEILAPNMRAVQVTDDLERFWRELYPRIRKQLSARYPKHEWR